MIVLVKKGEDIIIDSKKENPLHCVQYIPKSGVDIFQKLTKLCLEMFLNFKKSSIAKFLLMCDVFITFFLYYGSKTYK